MPPRAVTMVEEMNPKGTCERGDMEEYFPNAQQYESLAKNRATIMASKGFTVFSYEEVFGMKLRPLRREGCISYMYGDELGDHTWALTMENIVETLLEFRDVKGSLSDNAMRYIEQVERIIAYQGIEEILAADNVCS